MVKYEVKGLRVIPKLVEYGTMYTNDTSLIQACIDGEDAAWRELVERYGRLVYSIPLRNGLSSVDADDVFQNVFTIVFNQLSRLRNQNVLAAWLITITWRESRRLIKLARNQDGLDEKIEDDQPPPPDQVQTWERQHMVHQALGQLGSPCRELLTILFLETPTPRYEEIAKRLGVPVGSIGPTRARCFKKLEALLVSIGCEAIF
jgi:RNA polymerase sigma factor (sigma-70 family)